MTVTHPQIPQIVSVHRLPRSQRPDFPQVLHRLSTEVDRQRASWTQARGSSPQRNMRGASGSTTMATGTRRKSAPVGAPTPDDRGLADREEHDRLMGIMPSRGDAAPLCTNPHLDGCPNCVVNTEEPRHLARLDTGCDAGYRCTDCGHKWDTAWGCA